MRGAAVQAVDNSFTAFHTVVVGAGPSGLSVSRELGRAGIRHVVLERGEKLGHTWAHLYDGLVLHTGKHFSALPGLRFPSSTPTFPTRTHFVEYLDRYANTFQLPIKTGADVTSVRRGECEWCVTLGDGRSMRARVVVIATGIVSNPYIPEFTDRGRFKGRVLHTVDYRRPQPFAGERVLVVGAGNSAGEISAELAGAGARVTVAIRSGARVVPREILGIPVQYLGVAVRHVPRSALLRLLSIVESIRGAPALPRPIDSPCATVPLIGFHLADAVKSGQIQLAGSVSEFTASGVRFVDGSEQSFDTVMLATGYRAALGMLGPEINRDQCGFAARRDRVVSCDRPGLYFVGHNYDVAGGLRNIAQDARIAARLIAKDLRGSGQTYTGRRQRTNGK
jgi:cation diffusion facilitator CzcD-associated flavoprotein CzcO